MIAAAVVVPPLLPSVPQLNCAFSLRVCPLVASARGFLTPVGGQALELFRPQALEGWVCGTPHLEQNCRYEGGLYGHPVCRWFWYLAKEDTRARGEEAAAAEVLHLLFFITGSR